MKIYKIERVDGIEIEVGVECDVVSADVIGVLELLEIIEKTPIKDKPPVRQPLDIVVDALVNGFISKKELKRKLRGVLNSNEIERTLKEYKGKIFKYKKIKDDWFVGIVKSEESIELSDFDYLKFEKLF